MRRPSSPMHGGPKTSTPTRAGPCATRTTDTPCACQHVHTAARARGACTRADVQEQPRACPCHPHPTPPRATPCQPTPCHATPPRPTVFNAGSSQVETDKATMDFESQDEGVIAKILVEAGAEVKVGDPIMVTRVNGAV